MTQREQVLRDALALPPADQMFVVCALEDNLVAKLPPETPESNGLAGDELLEELRRRSDAYRTGLTTARDAAEVMADLRQRQACEAMN